MERELLNIDRKEKTCASDYEKIQVWNYLAYTYYSLDDFKKAIVYYEYIVNSPGEDDAFRLDTRRTLAQFYAQQERYLEAITQYEIWEAQAFSVGASDRLMMAQLYNVLEKKDKTLEMTKIGIDDAELKGEVPKEGFCKYSSLSRMTEASSRKLVKFFESSLSTIPSELLEAASEGCTNAKSVIWISSLHMKWFI